MASDELAALRADVEALKAAVFPATTYCNPDPDPEQYVCTQGMAYAAICRRCGGLITAWGGAQALSWSLLWSHAKPGVRP